MVRWLKMDPAVWAFRSKVGDAIEREIPALRNTTAVVAVSAGADSVALLRVLHLLREDFGLRLVVAHANHGLRGRDADEDERAVASLAASLGVPMESTQLSFEQRRPRGNLQQAAREERYRFFAEVAARCNTRVVALGHQREDQAETVLLHLLRGSGTQGLAAMRPQATRGTLMLARPLLGIGRAEILAFLQALGQNWREDASNRSRRYTRNRLRLDVFPALEALGGSGLSERLATTARLAAADDDLLVQQAQLALDTLCLVEQGQLVFSLDAFLALHSALQRRVLRLALDRMFGCSRLVPAAVIERIRRDLAEGTPQRDWSVGAGVVVRKRYDRLLIGPVALCCAPYHVVLDDERVFCLPDGGRISMRILPSDGSCPVVGGDCREAWLDADLLHGPVVARSRHPGDRIDLPNNGSQSLKKLFIALRIPREERWKVPVVCDSSRILWIPGVRRARHAWISPATRTALHLVYHAPFSR